MKLLSYITRSLTTLTTPLIGGVRLPDNKTSTSGIPIRHLPLPERFIIPIKQHQGSKGDLIVKKGEYVLKGQPLTAGLGNMLPVHAPTSGRIENIGLYVTSHGEQTQQECVFIVPDQLEQWSKREPLPNYWQYSPEYLIKRIHQAGIAGLGGVGFPSALKLANTSSPIKTIIINAAECEPYITADDRLIQEHADEIILGCRILRHILSPDRMLIGIEDNKPNAIAALQAALQNSTAIQLHIIPTKYPIGEINQLTTLLTGKEIPNGKNASEMGILMHNVHTVFAIKKAIIEGEPQIERVLTLTGKQFKRPGNVWAKTGTPIDFLLQQAEWEKVPGQGMPVILGGPLMGSPLSRIDAPILKINNCLLAPTQQEIRVPTTAQPCIRCGQCAQVCPINLLPQQLYWFSKGQLYERTKQYSISDCIECGLCEYTCPSQIPLMTYFQQAKEHIETVERERNRAQQAKQRYQAKQLRTQKTRQHKKTITTSTAESTLPVIHKNEISVTQQIEIPTQVDIKIESIEQRPTDENLRKEAIAAAIARIKTKKKHVADMPIKPSQSLEQGNPKDPRKAAIEAAIQRVKARKNTPSPSSFNKE